MTEDRDPDGYVMIHYPPGGVDPYGVGPFPPLDDLISALVAHPSCGCRVVALPVAFPDGIKVMLVAKAADIMSAIASLEQEDKDRLN